MSTAVCARQKRHLDPVETGFFGSASRLSRRLRSSLSLDSHHRRPSPRSEILSQVASVEWATGGALRGSSQLTGRRGAETLGHWDAGKTETAGASEPSLQHTHPTRFRSPSCSVCLLFPACPGDDPPIGCAAFPEKAGLGDSRHFLARFIDGRSSPEIASFPPSLRPQSSSALVSTLHFQASFLGCHFSR